ncbi:hypothetical protein DFH08DRAFT_808625 [Mycena albidolilacea]|uniref:Uncharacterized protein n=1 Tax=Mycena albidolilacea TaxID=1033008 RepID=A0AAD7A1T6_9AGAR|nr:hypothetical protein DFH08DRAFT_808625 [Mycena albidolilacea]
MIGAHVDDCTSRNYRNFAGHSKINRGVRKIIVGGLLKQHIVVLKVTDCTGKYHLRTVGTMRVATKASRPVTILLPLKITGPAPYPMPNSCDIGKNGLPRASMLSNNVISLGKGDVWTSKDTFNGLAKAGGYPETPYSVNTKERFKYFHTMRNSDGNGLWYKHQLNEQHNKGNWQTTHFKFFMREYQPSNDELLIKPPAWVAD